jgi:hypothetical protein
MLFLSIREFSKAPKEALSRLAEDGKAVLTSNGKPAAIMLNANTENFEQIFSLVEEAEKKAPPSQVNRPQVSEPDRQDKAFERLMRFSRKPLPENFDYKQALMEAADERFDHVN